ncbi:MAG TPA: heterodisulfide reductase-related iron-sulfur binding cluster [Spirillospora sp.]|nr:heterodisulfide reductase-related iron-sulfur binding cluster [Spirillospora sp.]
MLTAVEQMLFILLAALATAAALAGLVEMYRIINRGEGRLYLDHLPRRAWNALVIYLTQRTTLKTRRITSLFHVGVVWGFTFYFLVNLGDLLEGFLPDYVFLEEAGILFDLYRLAADIFSVAVLVGVAYFIIRRWYLPNRRELQFHDNILLHPQVKAGSIGRDSLIVAVFILIHVGARFLGQAVRVAASGPDLAQPFATLASPLFAGATADGLTGLIHLFWWVALGAILLFLPYFAHSKHAHLFMAPLNYLTRPPRTSPGELEALDFEDEDREQFGAARLEHLTQTQIFDAFACIQCNRCQDVCPAYVTGKELSPSALEINKRYMIRDQMTGLANGEEALHPLMGYAISESAVWACTSCGACIDICPVGNEPMHDIIDIRRDQVLVQGAFPAELQGAFNGMERQGNPWQQDAGERFRWAKGLDFPVPTASENPGFEILYWVGCAASYDPRAQLTARALVRVLHAAGVSFAVLGEQESCTGDVARRAGNEFLYSEMAAANVETLNAVNPPRIVVTCPHCFHNLGREYHAFGGHYDVIHHTELIEELIQQGRLPLSARVDQQPNVTFHDPCYLGRHNGVIDAPRTALSRLENNLIEMPRHGRNSFCCGAGGAQFWKEEEPGAQAVSVNRYEEARATGADILAVGCPFCMQMFETARSSVDGGPAVKDVAELIAERLAQPAES